MVKRPTPDVYARAEQAKAETRAPRRGNNPYTISADDYPRKTYRDPVADQAIFNADRDIARRKNQR